MTIIDPATGCFEIVKVPTFDLDELTGGNDEHIDKSSSRESQLFNNKWIFRYSCPRKVMLNNVYEFK